MKHSNAELKQFAQRGIDLMNQICDKLRQLEGKHEQAQMKKAA